MIGRHRWEPAADPTHGHTCTECGRHRPGVRGGRHGAARGHSAGFGAESGWGYVNGDGFGGGFSAAGSTAAAAVATAAAAAERGREDRSCD